MSSVNLLKKNIAGFTGRFMVDTTHSLGHNFLYTNIGFAGHSSFTVNKTADPKKINGVHLFGVYISPVSGRHIRRLTGSQGESVGCKETKY